MAGGVDSNDRAARLLNRLQNGVMFSGRTQRYPTGTENRRIVRFSPAASEHDLARPNAKYAGDLVASLIDRPPCVTGETMRTARVRKTLSEEREHRLDRGRSHRRRGRMIEVRDSHVTTLSTPPRDGERYRLDRMDGYDNTTYGDAFADIYDEWYQAISDIDATVADLLDLAGDGPIIELGVGTGRIAVPLAIAGAATQIRVAGVDSSEAMLRRLTERDLDSLVAVTAGDMVTGLPEGPFSLAFVAYNTLFNLTADDQQLACFRSVIERLSPGGRFVVEAFVPEVPADSDYDGKNVTVRSMTADRVVLSVTVHRSGGRLIDGQFVEFTEAGGVRLRPWSIRYSTPIEIDAIAAEAGFELEYRWEQFGRTPFTDDSPRHVSVYLKK